MAAPMQELKHHNVEIQRNRKIWDAKPLLAALYRDFYQQIAHSLDGIPSGPVVELGSGSGRITEVIPNCMLTDLFDNPWIDQTESAYELSFSSETVSGFILVDIFHHLRYPGAALAEMYRTLQPGGRVILLEPCMSLLGLLVYGPLHPEPLGLRDPIEWLPPADWHPADESYFAAQSRATRLFCKQPLCEHLGQWELLSSKRMAAISYVASGGYSGPQLYRMRSLPMMKRLDRLCHRLPWLFATRLLVVLQKPKTTCSTPQHALSKETDS